MNSIDSSEQTLPTPPHKVIDWEMVGKHMDSEVHNRAKRLCFKDKDHPLLKYYYTSEEDKGDDGSGSPQKLAAKLEKFLDEFWDPDLGDRHEWSAEKVLTVVCKNYFAALSKAVPRSFISSPTEMHMRMERALMGFKSNRKIDKSDCTVVGRIRVDLKTEKETFIRTYFPNVGKPKPYRIKAKGAERVDLQTGEREYYYLCDTST